MSVSSCLNICQPKGPYAKTKKLNSVALVRERTIPTRSVRDHMLVSNKYGE